MCDDNRTAATTTNTKSITTTTTASGCLAQSTLANSKFLGLGSAYSPYSVLAAAALKDAAAQSAALVALPNPALNTHKMLLTQRRRRFLQRHACLLSIVAAFVVGLVLGVLAPLMDMKQLLNEPATLKEEAGVVIHLPLKPMTSPLSSPKLKSATKQNRTQPQVAIRPPSDFPTIYDGLQAETEAEANPYTVAFVQEQPLELNAEEVFRNAFHLEQFRDKPGTMLVKKLDTEDGSIKEFQVERLGKGRYRKGPEKRLSKPTLTESMLVSGSTNVGSAKATETLNIVPLAQRILANSQADKQHNSIIKNDIFWGDLVEKALPKGFNEHDAKVWQHYVNSVGKITQLETGCGRMQNRLVVFADGSKACARYRQNTDQIQGEIFSYYLGQLLNISNLAPSAATVVDLNSNTWASALTDITQAQWKQQRPVVLTRWLPDLEPAGIPQPFQPLERHLNKYDVWNISLSSNKNNKVAFENEAGNIEKNQATFSSTSSGRRQHNQSASSNVGEPTSATATATITPSPAVLQRLVELAQWSDLIVFDYLIANLDRVVNNLYNFQWNADIMAAPAHNLARQTDTQLLVFLDNESGLLHGYRLLKKYEAYHGVLLDNLCVFRQPTIDALQQLHSNGAGRMLSEMFQRSTSNQVRDVLPSLPDKSIKILVDRIDRVLGQVQKCKDLLSDR